MSSVLGRAKRVAVLVEVAEQREAAVLPGVRRAVLVLAVEAGDVVVDELRGGGVVADDDEARAARRCLLCSQSSKVFS